MQRRRLPGRRRRRLGPVPAIGSDDRSAWTVRASSTRRSVPDAADGHTIDYLPRNAVDNNPSTAWCPGTNARKDGIGEWLEIDFPGRRRVKQIGMISGYPKQHRVYGDLFWINNRVREALVTFSDGSSVSWQLGDRKSMQVLTFSSAVITSSVRITILSVYPSSDIRAGKRRPDRRHDTPIAEIAFWGST